MKKKECILVTGGAGYIGSHTCKALSRAGYLPITYDNLSRGHQWAVKWGPLENSDIGNADRLEAVIKTFRPAAVMHFAAFAYVGESVSRPGPYYDNNLSGTITLLEAVRKCGVKSFIFSSSCATYGIPREIPIPETHPQNPIHPYGMSKMVVERILEDYAKAYGLCWASLRYFNAAGADPDGEIGECHDPETHLIPNILDTALGRHRMFTVNGADHDTPDGTCIRDFVHVADLADGHIRALNYLLQHKKSIIANLGTEKGYSVKEVIRMCEERIRRKIAVRIGERRPGDPPKLVASANNALKMLNWTPRLSNMETIIASAWAWHRRRTHRSGD